MEQRVNNIATQFAYAYNTSNFINTSNLVDEILLFKYEYFGIGNKYGINLGDFIQTIATKRLFNNLNLNMPYKYWDRDNLSNYHTSNNKAVTVMQGWFSFVNCSTFIPNNKIKPVYIGTHLTAAAQNNIINFIRYNPDYFNNTEIGCRDKSTRDFFNDIGVKSYFSRCLTLTLPLRDSGKNQNKIYFAQWDSSLDKYIPDSFLKNSIKTSHRCIDKGKKESHYVNCNNLYTYSTLKLFLEYKENAKLIFTNALHVAAPCIAMGIPVILINPNNNDYRYEALEGIIPIYSMEDLINNKIDYSLKAPNIEELKKNMIRNFELSINKALGKSYDEKELENIRKEIETFNILNK